MLKFRNESKQASEVRKQAQITSSAILIANNQTTLPSR